MPNPRPPVTYDAVVAAALATADDTGLHSVSMRTVAKRLGVTPMALYRHVADKEALLDALAEAVFAQFPLPEPNTPWREAMQTQGEAAYRVLSKHSWAPGFITSRRTLTGAALRYTEATLACLYHNGFTPSFAMHTMSLLDSYTYGFVITERDLPMRENESITDFVADANPHPEPSEYPCLTALLDDLATRTGYVYANEFQFGLQLILDGVQAQVGTPEAGQPS